MHPIEQLRDEVNYLRFATTIEPQDEERVLSLVEAVDEAYPSTAVPEEWDIFKSKLDTVLHGSRDSQVTTEMHAAYEVVEDEIGP